ALMLAGCGGGDSTPKATPVPSGEVSLMYTGFTPPQAAGSVGDAKVFELRDGDARLIKDYPGAAIVYMLASPDGQMLAFIENGVRQIVSGATAEDMMVLATPPVATTCAGPLASFSGDSKTFAYSRV